jgi:predicted kinase
LLVFAGWAYAFEKLTRDDAGASDSWTAGDVDATLRHVRRKIGDLHLTADLCRWLGGTPHWRRGRCMIYKGFVDFSQGADNRAMYWFRARSTANTGIGLMNPVVLDAHFAKGVTRVPKGALLVRQNVCAQLTDTVEVDT